MPHKDVKSPDEVLAFWFEELTRKQWFERNEAVDDEIAARFAATHLALARGDVDTWQAAPEHRLAAVIVLDQFPRNIYRGTALAFASDWLALREAKRAVETEADQAIAADRRIFLYLPFEHAEDIGEQNRSVELIARLGDGEYLDYAERHREVIAEFGRFPHRNVLLGRQSTQAELDYLARPGAGF